MYIVFVTAGPGHWTTKSCVGRSTTLWLKTPTSGGWAASGQHYRRLEQTYEQTQALLIKYTVRLYLLGGTNMFAEQWTVNCMLYYVFKIHKFNGKLLFYSLFGKCPFVDFENLSYVVVKERFIWEITSWIYSDFDCKCKNRNCKSRAYTVQK